MGKRPAGVELFEGNMASMQRGIRPSMQRDEPPTMETGLERIADKCCESTPEERSAGNLHATFCGRRRQVTASAHPVKQRENTIFRQIFVRGGAATSGILIAQ